MERCEMPACEYFKGWDDWSEWTRCEHNKQFRKRKCLVKPSSTDCIGPREQMRTCYVDINSNGKHLFIQFPFLILAIL